MSEWPQFPADGIPSMPTEAGGALPSTAHHDPLLQHAAPGVEWTPSVAPADDVAGADDTATVAVAAPGRAPARCVDCGGEVDDDGYCTLCGAKAPSERDHYREQPAGWVGGVCDRGRRHERNEDALATAASQEPGARAVLVVCDGVSNSIDSDVASLAAAEKARDVLWANQPRGIGTPESRTGAMAAALANAALQANDAVVKVTDPASQNPASATFAAAVVSDGTIFHANLGDSRVYWFSDLGGARQLSVDDSVAQNRIEAGVERTVAETGYGAHSITKWLGRDAVDLDPRPGQFEPEGAGWLLVCSDGLWNYASEPADLARVLADALADNATDVTDLSEKLVAWANGEGGHDNITLALARLGTPIRYAVPAPVEVEPVEQQPGTLVQPSPTDTGSVPTNEADQPEASDQPGEAVQPEEAVGRGTEPPHSASTAQPTTPAVAPGIQD